MSRGTILLRVDGSAEQGLGRMARCLALANALQRRRYQMIFVSQIDNSTWPDRIRRFRHAVSKTPLAAGSSEDREALMREVAQQRPVVVVTDSPNLDESYVQALMHSVPLVITIDELGRLRYPVDLVLNPTLGRTSKEYDLGPGAQILAGRRFAMIRAEFRRARNVRATEPGGPPRVLLALGGGDVADQTAEIAEAILHRLDNVEKVDAVIGSSRSSGKLDAVAAKFAGKLTITKDARDLGARMTKAHLLVTGGGNTALEAACVGIPMLIITRHAHHTINATWLEETGAAHYLGHHNKVKPTQVCRVIDEVLSDRFERRAMSRAGRMLIDGRGPDRLVTATEVLLCRSRKAKTLAA
jgi:spore coat polysaccharide biosynthesis predicted glycosyltransferase SpsG